MIHDIDGYIRCSFLLLLLSKQFGELQWHTQFYFFQFNFKAELTPTSRAAQKMIIVLKNVKNVMFICIMMFDNQNYKNNFTVFYAMKR